MLVSYSDGQQMSGVRHRVGSDHRSPDGSHSQHTNKGWATKRSISA